MLKSIVIGCHWPIPSPQLMLDQDTPLAIVSALMTKPPMWIAGICSYRCCTMPLLKLDDCTRAGFDFLTRFWPPLLSVIRNSV